MTTSLKAAGLNREWYSVFVSVYLAIVILTEVVY